MEELSKKWQQTHEQFPKGQQQASPVVQIKPQPCQHVGQSQTQIDQLGKP